MVDAALRVVFPGSPDCRTVGARELRDDVVSDLEEYERRAVNFHTDSIWPAEKYDDWRGRIARMIVRLQPLISAPKTSPTGR